MGLKKVLSTSTIRLVMLLGVCGSVPIAWAAKSPFEALIYWNIHANPDISRPDQISTLEDDPWSGPRARSIPLDTTQTHARAFKLPTSSLNIEVVGALPPDIRGFVYVDPATVRFPIQPDDHGIARYHLGKHTKEELTSYPIARSASRSTFVLPGRFSFKASTETTYGKNPNKHFGGELARQDLAANQWIQDVNFKYGIPVREPLFLTSGSVAVSFRDWSPFFSEEKSEFYLPMFSLTHPLTGTVLSLINGFMDPMEFLLEHGYFSLGRAQAEWAFKAGVEFETPHHQNFLLELDKNYRPTGRIIVIDYGDSHVNKKMLVAMNLQRELGEYLIFDQEYHFKVMALSGSDLTGWVTSSLDRDAQIPRAFAAGVMSYQREVQLAPGLEMGLGNSSFRDGAFDLPLVAVKDPRRLAPTPDQTSDTRDQRLAQRVAAERVLPVDLKKLYDLSGQALRFLVIGEKVPESIRADLERAFSLSKSTALLHPGEVGHVLRSRLVWAGVRDLDLAVLQIGASLNPIEIGHLLDEHSNSYRAWEALFVRLSSHKLYTGRMGMSDLSYRALTWLKGRTNYSPQIREAALAMEINGLGYGQISKSIARLFDKARSISARERDLLNQYRGNTTWMSEDESALIARILDLPTVNQDCPRLLVRSTPSASGQDR